MSSSVRFAEPEVSPSPRHDASGTAAAAAAAAAELFRLPRISASPADFPTGAAEAAAGPAIYGRNGYSPPRSPRDSTGHWKYPLPSKSFRQYVGPPLRDAAAAEGAPATGGRAAPLTSGRSGTDSSPRPLQRSRTEPAMAGSGQRQPPPQPHQRAAPYVQSRAQIFLRRRQPMPPPPGALARGATTMTDRAGDDEAERLRWTMSTQRHWQVDRKGQQRNQGPFSREFTVHVTAPSNWMRMKWGGRRPRQDWGPAAAAAAGEPHVAHLFTKQAFGHQQLHHGY